MLIQKHYDYIMKDVPRDIRDRMIYVDITPATKWFYEGTEQEEFDWRRDFPSIVPPWPVCWLEFAVGKVDNTPNGVITHNANSFLERVGYLVVTQQIKEQNMERVLEEDQLGMLVRASDDALHQRKITISNAMSAGFKCKWIVFCKQFALSPHHNQCIDFGFWGMYLDEMGQALPEAVVGLIPLEFVHRLQKGFNIDLESAEKRVHAMLGSLRLPLGFSISLLHCKNVSLENIQVPPKVIASRKKRGMACVQFKTLVVEPMKKRVIYERDNDPDGEQNIVKRALHICRGHFKDFRESGLFGKYYDIYWWGQHVRGDIRHGMIIKDYRVNSYINKKR